MIDFIKKIIFVQKDKFKLLDDKEFQNLLRQTPKPVIIDVRMKHEYATGKIHNALNFDILNVAAFESKVQHLDREKHYFIYCQTGKRSVKACRIMSRLGFVHLYCLKGGILNYSGKIV